MIRRVFLPVISAGILLYGGMPICPDDYAPASFEEASDELTDLIDEYFTDAGIPFPPPKERLRSLGLVPKGGGIYLRPGSLIRRGRNIYPFAPGIWKVEFPGDGIEIVHLLIREPQRLTEAEAFNTYNDRVGGLFADYDDQAYGLRMLPEDVRQHSQGRYFTLNVRIYGVADDATDLNRTVADLIFTDYGRMVQRYRQCGTER